MAAVTDPKGFKQDMVVSIRYRNDLPPPPMPPKLLDIDTGGLQQYLTTSFASGIARREEPNIEVDAEGGMPIDMIGIPGYFLGDESAIMAPEITPVLDPADLALMLTPEQLKNQGSKNQQVSFLRRTQYMAASQNARANDPLVRTNVRTQKSPGAKASITDYEDKENIKRHIQKGFDIAYPDSVPYNTGDAKAAPSTAAERDAWRNPVHPDNPRLKPVASYPILPDIDSFTDYGGYTSVKFDKPPLQAKRGRRDDRIDVALFRDLPNERLLPAHQAKKQAFERDPEKYDDPGPEPLVWTFHIPRAEDSTDNIKRILNDADPEKDSPALFENLHKPDEEMSISYGKVRVYPNATSQLVNSSRFLALSLFDPDKASTHSRLKSHSQAAYYYPIYQRLKMKTDRAKVGLKVVPKGAPPPKPEEQDSVVDFDGIQLYFGEPSLDVQQARLYAKAERDEKYRGAYEEAERLAEANAEAEQLKQSEAQDAEMDIAEVNGDIDGLPHRETGLSNGSYGGTNAEDDADAMEAD